MRRKILLIMICFITILIVSTVGVYAGSNIKCKVKTPKDKWKGGINNAASKYYSTYQSIGKKGRKKKVKYTKEKKGYRTKSVTKILMRQKEQHSSWKSLTSAKCHYKGERDITVTVGRKRHNTFSVNEYGEVGNELAKGGLSITNETSVGIDETQTHTIAKKRRSGQYAYKERGNWHDFRKQTTIVLQKLVIKKGKKKWVDVKGSKKTTYHYYAIFSRDPISQDFVYVRPNR